MERESERNGQSGWSGDPRRLERARVVLVLSLSSRSRDEVVRIIMDWLDDSDLCAFCRRNLDASDLAYIEGVRGTPVPLPENHGS